MKIIHLLQSNVFSGAENVACQIMNLFSDEDNFNMIYVSTEGTVRDAIESRGFKYIGINKLTFNKVRSIIIEQKPDVIHAHDITASVMACVSSIGLNIKIISHVHVNNANMAKFNVKTVLYYFSTYRYKHIFWVSKSCFDSYYFKNRVKSKSSILSNVMEKEEIINRSLMDDNNAPIFDVIYVGRLVFQKNPERLINVLYEVVKRLPDIRIGIIGDGDLYSKTYEYARNLGILNNVTFLGYKNNPLCILSKAKVMVMTSRYEGLPMTVLEALALGVPIISTPVDGLIDIIKNGENGFLSDDNCFLVDKICSIVCDKKVRSYLSYNSIKTFDELCNLEKYKQCILEAYEKS